MSNLHFRNIFFEVGSSGSPTSSIHGLHEAFYGLQHSECFTNAGGDQATCVGTGLPVISTPHECCDLNSHIQATLTNIRYGGENGGRLTALTNWDINNADITLEEFGPPHMPTRHCSGRALAGLNCHGSGLRGVGAGRNGLHGRARRRRRAPRKRPRAAILTGA